MTMFVSLVTMFVPLGTMFVPLETMFVPPLLAGLRGGGWGGLLGLSF
jgi:hypothetical protein